jgi:23S rRNA pseudouridine1911/1915/1917 synthase
MMTDDLKGPHRGAGSPRQAEDIAGSRHGLFTVDHADAWQRLDVFLSRQFADCSRSGLQTLIREGEVQVNGLSVKPSYEVRTGDQISVRIPAPQAQVRLVPQAMPLDILYEDEDLLVINKAPGVVVHPGAGHFEGTLVHGLLAHCPQLASQGAPLRPGIVHRLDKDTSGALVVAKTGAAYLDLIKQFKDHTVEKHYLALVYGSFSQTGGQLTTSLGRHPVDRKKIAVQQGKGLLAVTSWRVEKAWNDEVTLLRVTIQTGRTHQIRVHLSYLKHPVVGDATYGGGRRQARSLRSERLRTILAEVDRQLLHARVLGFQHPKTNQRLRFEAPLPDDFAEVLERLEAKLSPRSS